MMTDEVIPMNQHARLQPVSIDISGMSCASCVARVEKALLKVPGVTTASVNLATERATIELADAGQMDALYQAIDKAGYQGQPTPAAHSHSGHQHHDEDAAILRRDVAIAAVLTLPIFVVEMGGHLFMPFHMWVTAMVPGAMLNVVWFVLTSIVLFGPGLRFFKLGIPALLRGAP